MLGVGESGTGGRGVFARARFLKGEVIERAPVLVVPAAEWEHVEKTRLCLYCYRWGADREDAAIALGYGSLYNHSYRPNAIYLRVPGEMAIHFTALRDIEVGEEITINYNGSPDDPTPLWFDGDSWGWHPREG